MKVSFLNTAANFLSKLASFGLETTSLILWYQPEEPEKE